MPLTFLQKSFTIQHKNFYVPEVLWFTLTAVAAIAEMSRGYSEINNYLIFKGVFWHSVHAQPLYVPYLSEYQDTNHYGPVFSVFIAPFAILPTFLGCFLWCICNAWVLWYAIKKLPITLQQQLVFLLICLVELMTSIHNVQFNPMLTGWMLLAFVLVKEEKDFWATFFIAAGFLVKLYGIGALVFFLFSKHKLKFIGSFIGWLVVLFVLPMLISSPTFVLNSYADWYHSLADKHVQNVGNSAVGGMQDISAMGFFRRVLQMPNLSGWWAIVPGGLLYLLPLLRVKFYNNNRFQWLMAAATLIGVVILSSSAESPTYIIAVAGVAIWYTCYKTAHNTVDNFLLFFALIFTSLSATDIFPGYIRANFITAYSIKALPCMLIFFKIGYELLTSKFANN